MNQESYNVRGLITKRSSKSILWIESTDESYRRSQNRQSESESSSASQKVDKINDERDSILFPFLHQACLAETTNCVVKNWHINHDKVPVTEWFDWVDGFPHCFSTIPEIRQLILHYADPVAWRQWIYVSLKNCQIAQAPIHIRQMIYEYAAEDSRPLISLPIHIFSNFPQTWSESWPDHKTPFLDLTINHIIQQRDVVRQLTIQRNINRRKNITCYERELFVLDNIMSDEIIGTSLSHLSHLNIGVLWRHDIISALALTRASIFPSYICMTFKAVKELLKLDLVGKWIVRWLPMSVFACTHQLYALLAHSEAQQSCFMLCIGPGNRWKLWSP
jgi:hypothetical protein